MKMRVRFEKRGAHYHCRVFTRIRDGSTWEKAGDLVFREEEWPERYRLFRNAEFLEEGLQDSMPAINE